LRMFHHLAIVTNLYASHRFQLFGAPYPRSILILLILTLSLAVLSLIPAIKLRLSMLRVRRFPTGDHSWAPPAFRSKTTA